MGGQRSSDPWGSSGPWLKEETMKHPNQGGLEPDLELKLNKPEDSPTELLKLKRCKMAPLENGVKSQSSNHGRKGQEQERGSSRH